MMQERHIKLVFEEIDTDGSGALDMQEFLSYYCPGENNPNPKYGFHALLLLPLFSRYRS